MSTIEKTLYLARHAKSSWNSGAPNDYQRPLSKRGQHNAEKIGAELAKRGWKPELVITSPAIRASQTCQVLCKHLGVSKEQITWNREVYAAYMVTLLHLLSKQAETTSSIMLVGHNPSIEDLLLHLCGESIWQDYAQQNGKLFTTGNVAKITLNDTWQNLAMGNAKLVSLLRPKEC